MSKMHQNIKLITGDFNSSMTKGNFLDLHHGKFIWSVIALRENIETVVDLRLKNFISNPLIEKDRFLKKNLSFPAKIEKFQL